MDGRFARACAWTAFAALAAAAHAGAYRYRPPSPIGEVAYARPEVRWAVWNEDGLAVRSVRMELDGREVRAEYRAAERAAVYRPDGPLAPGRHRVDCTVDFGKFEARHEWTFVVRADAVSELPGPGAEATVLARAVEGLRHEAGLAPARLEPALCAAASMQAGLVAESGRFDHYQDAGAASDPGGRARLFGYSGGVSELLAWHHGPPAQAVRSLFDAPYHRVPLLTPGTPDLGAAARGRVSALLVGAGSAGDVPSPRPGATGVPREWDGVESPDPLRGTGLQAPVGYPVVLALHGEPGEWALASARLSGHEGRVECVVRHRGNDVYAQNAVILVPHRPLAPGARHVAEVTVVGSGGLRKHRWEFTTK